ncbi:MAG: SDR family oxidoreductase [Planctomycetes bacterium]|nr:SDR family oxidoreductase [Planctomycetota bacterium]MCP4838416.1 SDR family oxidoreductase [Planctomycetota bacterium]
MPRRVQLDGKPIVITGGGTGIGAATAKICAAAGMPVVLAGRRTEPLEATKASIEAAGGRAHIVSTDVTQGNHATEILDAGESVFGPAWAVFANAGRGLDRAGHTTTEEELRSIFEVNFFATHILLTEAAERMLGRREGGHLLACASCVSKFSPPYHGAYAASKAAQDLFCQAMRLELAPFGIFVSTIHPITTTTEFFDVSAQVSGRSTERTSVHLTPKFFRQSPEQVARSIFKCLRKPVPEVWTSTIVRITAAMRTLRPTLMDRQMKRMLDERSDVPGQGS